MPPHLHPRSAATSTLFAGTLLASFVVVAVPHIWPCPRPRRAYMDGESDIIIDDQGRVMRRVWRVKQPLHESDGTPQGISDELAAHRHAHRLGMSCSTVSVSAGKKTRTLQEEAEILQALQAEGESLEKQNARRECPVPKPTGALGRFLGFDAMKKD